MMYCSSTATAHDGTLFCHPCHRRNFGLKGYGYGQGAGVLATDSGGVLKDIVCAYVCIEKKERAGCLPNLSNDQSCQTCPYMVICLA